MDWQAIGQCSEFLEANCGEAALISADSTAAAAESLLYGDNSGVSAAICSKICAPMYGLEVLAEGIQNDSSELSPVIGEARILNGFT